MPAPILSLSTTTLIVRHDPAARQFVPAPVEITFTSTSDQTERFRLELIGLPVSWLVETPFEGAPYEIELAAQASHQLALALQPPRLARTTAGSRQCQLRLTATARPEEAITQPLTIQVDPFTEHELALSAARVDGNEATFTLGLSNGGNLPITYGLSVVGPLPLATGAEPLPAMVTLAAGSERTITFSLQAPTESDGTTPLAGGYRFELLAQPVELAEPPLQIAGFFAIAPPPPIKASLEPTTLELIDPLQPSAITNLHLINPRQQPVTVAITVQTTGAAYTVDLPQRRVVLLPLAERTLPLTVSRLPSAQPVNQPLSQSFQINLRALERPSPDRPRRPRLMDLQPDGALAALPLAEEGGPATTVTFTALEPVTVTIQPLRLALDLAPLRHQGQRGHFQVTLTNQGSQPLPTLLTVSHSGPAFTYHFDDHPPHQSNAAYAPPSGQALTVEPRTQRVTILTIQGPRRRLGGPSQRYPFRLGVRVDGKTSSGLVRAGEFIEQPPSRLLLAAPLTALLLLFGSWALLTALFNSGAAQAASGSVTGNSAVAALIAAPTPIPAVAALDALDGTSTPGTAVTPAAAVTAGGPAATAPVTTNPASTTVVAAVPPAPATATAPTVPAVITMTPTPQASPTSAATTVAAVTTLTAAPTGRPTVVASPAAVPNAVRPPAEPLQSWVAHAGAVRGVAFAPDGELLATTSVDTTVRLWRVSDKAPVEPILRHPTDVYAVAFSPFDRQLLLTGAADGYVRLWHLDRKQMLWRQFQGGNVATVAFSPSDPDLVASGAGDGTVRLWRITDGGQVRVFGQGLGGVERIAFTHDGSLLAAGTTEGHLRIWRVRDGQSVTPLAGHPLQSGIDPWIEAIALSPDSQLLASGSHDETVRLWRISDGRPVGAPLPIGGPIKSLAFVGPNGRWLAVATTSNTLQFWLVSEQRLLVAVPGHDSGILNITVSPDGQTLATTSNDRTVRLWRLNSP